MKPMMAAPLVAFVFDDSVMWLVVVAIVVAFVVLKRATVVSADAARKLLAEGAKVVDVRTAGEFEGRHLPGVIHLPLNELAAGIAARVPDKETPVLLHCLSGARSAAGVRILRGLGYRRAHNLGSYGRAERLLGNRSAC